MFGKVGLLFIPTSGHTGHTGSKKGKKVFPILLFQVGKSEGLKLRNDYWSSRGQLLGQGTNVATLVVSSSPGTGN